MTEKKLGLRCGKDVLYPELFDVLRRSREGGTMNDEKVDVIAVSLDDSRVLWVMPNKTNDNAEACILMAVARQGVEDRYFTTVALGRYKAGDIVEHHQ